MKRFAIWIPVFAGVVGVSGAGAVGCGGDSATEGPVDSGNTDGTVQSGSDTGSDGKSSSEAAVLSDGAGTSDADSTTGDADATIMGDADASVRGDGSPTSDAEAASPETDAASDGLLAAAYAFPGQVAAANCDRIAACCGTSGDAAAFNWAKCIGVILPNGFNGSNASANLIDGGHVTFDPVQARACLNTFAAIDCTANDITQALEAQLYQSCFLAFQGTLKTGSPCIDPIECAPGNFCDPTDGGQGDSGAAGICQPLRDAGEPCSDFGNSISKAETVCSYRGSTNTGLHCRWATTSPPTILDAASWVCATANDIDSGCVRNEECTTHLCTPSPAFTCVAAESLIGPAGCAAYLIADAGGG